MRIEKDWMIHCKKLEQRLKVSEICSSKEQIMQRVGNIMGLQTPIIIYLAVADDLLEDNSILEGWREALLPLEKTKLGILDLYKKHPYLIQFAMDYEVCLRSDVFVGNSFSTFSSLVVLERTQLMISKGASWRCRGWKSSLVLRFVKGQFVEFQESTIGAAFFSQTVAVMKYGIRQARKDTTD